jgi:hypothetical protein
VGVPKGVTETVNSRSAFCGPFCNEVFGENERGISLSLSLGPHISHVRSRLRFLKRMEALLVKNFCYLYFVFFRSQKHIHTE